MHKYRKYNWQLSLLMLNEGINIDNQYYNKLTSILYFCILAET